MIRDQSAIQLQNRIHSTPFLVREIYGDFIFWKWLSAWSELQHWDYYSSAAMSSTPETCVNSKDGTASVQVSGSTGVSLYTWDTDPIQNTTTAIGLSSEIIQCLYPQRMLVMGCECNGECTYRSWCLSIGWFGKWYHTLSGFIVYSWRGKFSKLFVARCFHTEKFIVDRGGKYSVKIVNNAGCTTSDSIEIIEDCLNDIIFPNAFTPNQDGKMKSLFLPAVNYRIIIWKYLIGGDSLFWNRESIHRWDGKYRGSYRKKEFMFTKHSTVFVRWHSWEKGETGTSLMIFLYETFQFIFILLFSIIVHKCVAEKKPEPNRKAGSFLFQPRRMVPGSDYFLCKIPDPGHEKNKNFRYDIGVVSGWVCIVVYSMVLWIILNLLFHFFNDNAEGNKWISSDMHGCLFHSQTIG